MPYTEEQLLETYQKLPTDIQLAIADAETEKKITAIGYRHNLHVDKIGDLADETGLVMLGLKHPKQFVSSLAERLGLALNEAETIAQEVNTEVLMTIRDTIKKMAEPDGGDNSLSRDQVLSEIENPIKPPATAGIFEQKVSQIFNLPSEKADVTPAATEVPVRQSLPDKPLKPWEQDPYLEKP
jgi:hypothetical protein